MGMVATVNPVCRIDQFLYRKYRKSWWQKIDGQPCGFEPLGHHQKGRHLRYCPEHRSGHPHVQWREHRHGHRSRPPYTENREPAQCRPGCGGNGGRPPLDPNLQWFLDRNNILFRFTPLSIVKATKLNVQWTALDFNCGLFRPSSCKPPRSAEPARVCLPNDASTVLFDFIAGHMTVVLRETVSG